MDYPVFEVIFRYLTLEESQSVFSRVCRQWRHLHSKMFSSYSSASALSSIDNSKLSSRELQILLEKGVNMSHIRMLGDILRRDFRNQVKFFN